MTNVVSPRNFVRHVRVLPLFAIAVVVLTAGCTSPDTVAPTRAALPTTAPQTIPTASPSPSAQLSTPPPLQAPKLVDAGIGPDEGFGAVAAASSRYVIRPNPADLHGVEVVKRAGGQVILRHRPIDEGRFETTGVAIAGDRAVIADEDVTDDDSMALGSRKRPAVVYVVDLSTGHQSPLSALHSAPHPSPYAAAQDVTGPGNLWYYSAQTAGHYANCIAALNLHTLQGKLIYCAPGTGQVFFIKTGDRGAAWMTLPGGSLSLCRTAAGIDAGTTYAIASGDCDVFDVARLGPWRLWSDQGHTDMQPYIPLHAANGATTAELGDMRPQSLVVCGGYAYWDVQSRVPDSIDNLVRWKPGWSRAQTVLVPNAIKGSKTEDELIWPEGCNDDILTITVVRYYDASATSTLQILTITPDTKPTGTSTP